MLVIEGKEFKNHYNVDGVIIRGDISKTVVKPNKDGLYNIRLKRKDHFYTKEQVYNVKVEKRSYSVKHHNKTLGALVAEFGTSHTELKNWMKRNGHDNKRTYTMEEYRELLVLREKSIQEKSTKHVRRWCEEKDVNYDGYKSYLRRSKVNYSDLTAEGHKVQIVLYRDQRFFKNR